MTRASGARGGLALAGYWQVTFEPRDARYVRLRLIETAEAPWTIGGLRVLGPAPGR